MKVEHLIKNGIINESGGRITLSKKKVEDKYFSLILEEVPNPIELDLSDHHLTKQQLFTFLSCSSIQKLKMNFTNCDEEFLVEAFKHFPNLYEVELNSAEIDDEILARIAINFSKQLKKLQLMDNKITDEGLEKMFFNFKQSFDSLHLSYNSLTSKSIDVIGRNSSDLRTLHIAKCPIKTKGATSIGRYLKSLT